MIYKGSAGGTVTNFKVRSCFYFTAIQPALKNKADISRVTLIEVVKDNDKIRYGKLKSAWQILTDELCDSFFIWIIQNTQIILKNIDSFSPVVATLYGGNARNGDQIGTLLACAWTAINGRIGTDLEIKNYLIQYQNIFTESSEVEKNESDLLFEFIMQQHVSYEGASGRKNHTVGYLLSVIGGNANDIAISRDEAILTLSKYGIYCQQDYFGIENNAHIRKWLRDSSWSGGFVETLKRHRDAEETMKHMKFFGKIFYVLKFKY